MNKIQKDQKANSYFWAVGSKGWVLHMIPAHSTTEGVGRTLKPPLQAGPMDPALSSPHLRGQLPLHRKTSKDSYNLFSSPPAAPRVSIKACLNFSSYQFLLFEVFNNPGQ